MPAMRVRRGAEMQNTLIEIATQYKADAEALANLDLPDEVVADTLTGMAGGLQEKATNVAAVALSLEGVAEQIKAAEERMSLRRKALENRARKLRTYLLTCMQLAEVKKIETPELRISVRKGPPSVVVDDAADVPAQYWRIPDPPPAAIDKDAIKTAIRAGEAVPGVHLEQSERIHID